MQTISSLTWGGGRRLHFHNSQWSVTLLLSSFLCQHRHTGACHLAVEFFMPGAFAWSQLAVTPSCARLNAAQRSEVIPLRQNRGEKRKLVGTVNARAVLFQGLARYIFNNWAIWNNAWFHLHLQEWKPLLCLRSYSLFHLREHPRRIKTNPAANRILHSITDIYYDKKCSLVSIRWAGLIAQAFLPKTLHGS